MSTPEKPHGGHRSRLRERFIKEGLDSFEEHNILELLLFYAIPQKDTNELAHALLNRFGTLEGVLRADIAELTEVNGVGLHTAEFITHLSDMVKRYLGADKKEEGVEGFDNITAYAIGLLSVSRNEQLAIFLSDSKPTLLSWHILQNKEVNAANVDNRLLMRLVIDTNATHIILVHKYVNKKGVTKRTDNCIAVKVNELLMAIGVRLKDYIIIDADSSIKNMLTGS